MISKTEFEIIKALLTNPIIDENKFSDEICVLLKDKFIFYNVIGENTTNVIYEGYKITPRGLRAYEEYVAFVESQNREIEAVKIAKEANNISKQANDLSKQANNIASGSKTLSKWAIGVSIFAVLVSVANFIVEICKA